MNIGAQNIFTFNFTCYIIVYKMFLLRYNLLSRIVILILVKSNNSAKMYSMNVKTQKNGSFSLLLQKNDAVVLFYQWFLITVFSQPKGIGNAWRVMLKMLLTKPVSPKIKILVAVNIQIKTIE